MNSALNKTFQLPSPGDQTDAFFVLVITQEFGDYLGIDDYDVGVANSSNPAGSTRPSNPFNIQSSNFSVYCSTAGGIDFANITNIFTIFGLIHGAPQRQDAGNGHVFESGSQWSQPLYTCASALKATIKIVSFSYNGIDASLENLAITSTQDKNSLYLPGWNQDAILNSPGADYMPGAEAFIDAMDPAYDVNSGGSYTSNSVDYTGTTDISMLVRWQNLSQSAERVSQIPNLIWADTAAAALVGTKGVLGPGNTATENILPILVTPTASEIKYHWPYAIPAFLASLIILLITIVAVITLLFGHNSIARLRLHLQRLSPGRIFTTFLIPE
ncbi:hypothetical protein V8E51_012012 [Hyaloscypha variabilis]